MSFVCILQARMTSSRLPGKVLLPLGDKTVLEYLFDRLKQAKNLDQIILATSIDSSDDVIENICKLNQVQCFRGHLDDVLDRYYQCARKHCEDKDYIVRITGDCPLIDPDIVDRVITFMKDSDLDYCSNTLTPSFPDGQDVAIAKYETLKQAHSQAKLKSEREHVFPYVVKNSTYMGKGIFKSGCYKNKVDQSMYRLTVDGPEDYELIKILARELDRDSKANDYVKYLDENPEVFKLNHKFKRNEGLLKSEQQD